MCAHVALCLQWKAYLTCKGLEDIKKQQPAAKQAELKLEFQRLSGGTESLLL